MHYHPASVLYMSDEAWAVVAVFALCLFLLVSGERSRRRARRRLEDRYVAYANHVQARCPICDKPARVPVAHNARRAMLHPCGHWVDVAHLERGDAE